MPDLSKPLNAVFGAQSARPGGSVLKEQAGRDAARVVSAESTRVRSGVHRVALRVVLLVLDAGSHVADAFS